MQNEAGASVVASLRMVDPAITQTWLDLSFLAATAPRWLLFFKGPITMWIPPTNLRILIGLCGRLHHSAGGGFYSVEEATASDTQLSTPWPSSRQCRDGEG